MIRCLAGLNGTVSSHALSRGQQSEHRSALLLFILLSTETAQHNAVICFWDKQPAHLGLGESRHVHTQKEAPPKIQFDISCYSAAQSEQNNCTRSPAVTE